jgi:hypothetical protein
MAYDPPPGTIQARVIDHLRSLPPGTQLRTAELVAAVGLELGPNASLHNYMTTAIKHGAVVQHPDPTDRRRMLWWLGDGTPPERQLPEGERAEDDDAPLERRPRKAQPEGPQPPRLDQLIAAGAPAVDAAIEKLTALPEAPKAASELRFKVEATYGTDPASGQVSPELLVRDACDQLARALPDASALIEVCCGNFDACGKPCTPRGVHIGRKEAATGTDLFDVQGYELLAGVLVRAYAQAAEGKGAQRHAQGQPFHAQPMQQLIRLYGIGFALGQAAKKAQEAQRLPTGERQVAELLGAINYLAGAVIALENSPTPESPK